MKQIQSDYFEARKIVSDFYRNYKLPHYIHTVLPKDKAARILDIGCGFGQNMLQLQACLGYTKVFGVDQDERAVAHCRENGLQVECLEIDSFLESTDKQYDFLTMNHVLEHIRKEDIISTLSKIRNIIAVDGALFLTVPNAQANTEAYWAFEDFTHSTLFTSGSIYYVLKMAGFTKVDFIDPDGVDHLRGFRKLKRQFLLGLYKRNKRFWNKVTSSAYHSGSPQIFTYELKVLAHP